MSAKDDEWLRIAERSIKHFLREHEEPIAIEDLIKRLKEIELELARHQLKSVELKIAALALVNKGDAELNRSWELTLSNQGRFDESEPVAA